MTARNVLAIFAVAFAAVPAGVSAQVPAAAGSWVLDADRSQSPQEALSAAVGGDGPVAMRRSGDGGGGGGTMVIRSGGPGGGMMAMLQPAQRLRLELAGDAVVLHLDEQAPLSMSLGGEPVSTRRWDQDVRVTASVAGDTLVVVTTTASGATVRELITVGADRDLVFELHLPLPVMGAAQAEPRTVRIRRVYSRAG